MNGNNDRAIALLIDGENISPKHFQQIRESLLQKGKINIFRIYADWTLVELPKGWEKDVLSEFPFVAIQQFSLGSGKNSSDSALIIDAMDLIHQKDKEINCIALASSDSDFTGLALNLRGKGLHVIGYGEDKTPKRLRNACHEFVVLNEIANSEIDSIICRAVQELGTYEEHFCGLGQLSLYLRKIKPDFNVKNDLGVDKFSDYFKKHSKTFQLEMPEGPGPAYVKIKEKEVITES